MLLPTQQAYGQVATNLMQSILDEAEERNKKRQEETSTKPKTDPMVEAKMAASEEAKRARDKIATALFGTGQIDLNQMRLDMIEKLSEKLGIDMEEAKSSYSLGSAFEEAIKALDPGMINKLEKQLGLDEMKITLTQFAAAVKNPYGDDNERLKNALEKKAGAGSDLVDTRKVLQRLEDVADPKSLAELKLGPQYSDPTRVEDAETRAERKVDIANAEASLKLEDVQKAQDVIEKHNDLAAKLPEGAVEAIPSLDPANMLQALAAAAEQVETVDDAQPSEGETPVAEEAAAETAEDPTSEAEAQIQTQQAVQLQEQQAEDALQPDVLPVHVDEIGLYSVLKKLLPEAA